MVLTSMNQFFLSHPILKGLSPQDMKDLAAYVSRLPWKKPVEVAEGAEAPATAQ